MPGVQESYSIDVSNRYELSLFGADEDDNDSTGELDPLDALKQIEEQAKREVELKKKAALKAKHVKKTPHFKENKDSNRNVTPKTEDNGKDLKGKEINNNNAKNQRRERQTNNSSHIGDENRRPPRRRNENRRPPRDSENAGTEMSGGDAPNRFNRDGDRRPERFRGGRGGGFRGGYRGNRFGGYRNDGRDDRGKREFDRRSGSDRSGVKATEKREGGGSHNWGTPEEEIVENVKGLDDSNYENDVSPTKNDIKPDQENENGNDGEKEEKSEEETKEKEPVEMTLDEWKAIQAAKVKPTHKVRRPGEGENPDQWKGMKVIHKSKEEVEAAESAKENVKTQVKPTIPVNIRFGDSARPGGRGGRGQRGARRGAPRQYGNRDSYGNSRQAPPDVENERDFPRLG